MKEIEEKAQQYASMMLDEDNIFYNYLRGQLVKAYIAGAKEVEKGQWHSVDDILPEIGVKVIWQSRVRTPKGTWLDSYLADTYDGEYMPENTERWMALSIVQR